MTAPSECTPPHDYPELVSMFLKRTLIQIEFKGTLNFSNSERFLFPFRHVLEPLFGSSRSPLEPSWAPWGHLGPPGAFSQETPPKKDTDVIADIAIVSEPAPEAKAADDKPKLM